MSDNNNPYFGIMIGAMAVFVGIGLIGLVDMASGGIKHLWDPRVYYYTVGWRDVPAHSFIINPRSKDAQMDGKSLQIKRIDEHYVEGTVNGLNVQLDLISDQVQIGNDRYSIYKKYR